MGYEFGTSSNVKAGSDEGAIVAAEGFIRKPMRWRVRAVVMSLTNSEKH